MPEPARSRLLKASLGLVGHDELAQAAAHGERFSPDTTRRVSQRIADKVRAMLSGGNLYDDDRLTPRLIREGLFAARSNHMHYAAIALLGSPMRSPLAQVLTEEIRQWSVSGSFDLMTGALLASRFQFPDLATTPVLQDVEKIRRNI